MVTSTSIVYRSHHKLIYSRIDVLPYNTFAGLYEAKIHGFSEKVTYLPKPLKSKPYYNTFIKQSDYFQMAKLINQYDKIIVKMKKDGTLKKILSKYGI